MAGFIIRRLGAMVLVIFAVSVLTFAMFNVLPNGDPEDRLAPRGASETQREAIRQEWDFDEPVYVQYLTSMEKIFTGDVQSYTDDFDVDAELWKGLPRTIFLGLGAALLWFVVGVALGVLTAVREGGWTDRLVTVLAIVGVSLPVFWVGALGSYYVGYKWGLLPDGGYATLDGDGPWEWFKHLLMPWVVLSLVSIGVYARVLRTNMLDAIDEDYVRTARAKGIGERQVLSRHVLRNALIPIITLWGLDVGIVLGGGAVLTETVFDLQGVGQQYATAIDKSDLPSVLTLTILGACFIVVLNAIVDVVYAALDPRIRL